MANIGSMDDIQSLFKETIAELMENGLTYKDVCKNLVGDSTWGPYPEGFEPDSYCIKPAPFPWIGLRYLLKEKRLKL